MKKRDLLYGLLIVGLLLASFRSAVALAATSTTLGFIHLTNNDPDNTTIGEAQLYVDIICSTPDATEVTFKFRNIGPEASSITDIYFDDGTLLGIASITNSSGVSFSQGASPGNLPGGNNANPPFETTAGFLADSDAPVQPNGINPNEWLEIVFNLTNGFTCDDVVPALAAGRAGSEEGGLRIGIHVQGFANGGSESFITGDVPTAITLATFTAEQSTDGGVGVAWTTAVEIEHAGFNLYRSSGYNGAYEQLNGQLIAAHGVNGQGSHYRYLDSPGAGTWYYMLEDVDIRGVTTRHGPVSVTVQVPTAISLNSFRSDPRSGSALWKTLVAAGALSAAALYVRRRMVEGP